MFYKGDSVKIIKTGDRNYGKFGVVQGIKTAMEDKYGSGCRLIGEAGVLPDQRKLILGTPGEKERELMYGESELF